MSIGVNPFAFQLNQLLQLMLLPDLLRQVEGSLNFLPNPTEQDLLPNFNNLPVVAEQGNVAAPLLQFLLLETLLNNSISPIQQNVLGVETSAPLNAVAIQTQNTPPVKPTPPKKKPLILIEGDSMSSVNFRGNISYPVKLKASLGNSADFSFQANSGDQMSVQMVSQAANNAKLYDADRQANIVVLWGGTNDIYFGKSADTAFDALKKTAQTYKDKGFKVVVLTAAQHSYGENNADNKRKNYNDLIRNTQQPPWDEMVDIAKLPEFSDENDAVASNTKYYSDKVHLTDAGNALISKEVEKAIKKFL